MPPIRSTTTAPSHGQSRTRSSVACQTCRQKKIRCDAQELQGHRQQCTPCMQSGLDCLVDRNSDRRKHFSRRYVEELHRRIQSLEASSPRPVGDAAGASSSTQPIEIERDSTINVPNHSQPLGGTPSLSMTRSTDVRYLLNSNKDNHGDGSAVFGFTTPAHVLRREEEPLSNISECSEHIVDDLQVPGVDVDMNSAQLRSHLLRIYFKYERLWLSVVHKGVFMEHRARGVISQWYSKFLESALLACASRISTSSAVRALGNDYAKDAKSRLLEAVENPSPASLQGFMILSEYEVSLGHERTGWMLCGMACRMITDLGLQRRMEPASPSAIIEDSAATEANLYFLLLCASISYEGIWCLYLGRPSSISKSIIDAALDQCKVSPSPSTKMAVAWVGLCSLMAQANDLLNNSDLPMPLATTRLRELDQELQLWQESQPTGVRYSDTGIEDLDAEAYGLQMQYCKIRILLRKSPLTVSSATKRKLSHTEFVASQEIDSQGDAREVIYDQALHAAKLLLTYRQLFGLDRIGSIMLDNANLAATTLINHLLSQSTPNESDDSTKQWLRSIIATLDGVHLHFPITKRMTNTLRHMVANTPLSGIFNAPSPSSNIGKSPSLNSAQEIREISDAVPGTPELDFSLNPQSLISGNPMSESRPFLYEDSQRVDPITSLNEAWIEHDASDLATLISPWHTSNFLSHFALDPLGS